MNIYFISFINNYLFIDLFFFSFQIAHMFPDYIGGGLDIISDAKNIKKIFSLPLNSDSVIIIFFI